MRSCRRAYPISKKRSVRTLPLSVKHRDALVLNRRGMAIYTVCDTRRIDELLRSSNAASLAVTHSVRVRWRQQEYMPAVDEPTAYVFMCHDYGDHSSWFLRDLGAWDSLYGHGTVLYDENLRPVVLCF